MKLEEALLTAIEQARHQGAREIALSLALLLEAFRRRQSGEPHMLFERGSMRDAANDSLTFASVERSAHAS